MADLFLHDPHRNAGALTLDDPHAQEGGGAPPEPTPRSQLVVDYAVERSFTW